MALAACGALLMAGGGTTAYAAGTPAPSPSPTLTVPIGRQPAAPAPGGSRGPSAPADSAPSPSAPQTPSGSPSALPSGSPSALPSALPSGSPSGSASGSPEAVAPPNGGDAGWSDADVLKFWTPERMASATDPGRPASGAAAEGSAAARSMGALDMPTAEHFLGAKSVGTVFVYDTKDPTTGQAHAYSCSASVVDSPGHNLILTAGHCSGGKAVFVPWYRSEATLDKQTYGFYKIDNKDWYFDRQYEHNTMKATSDLDYAFAKVSLSPSGKKVQDVVGANTLARTPRFDQAVTMIGYPKVKHNPEGHPVRCPARTSALPGFNQMRVECAGMWGGVSGGPWFSKINWETGTGEIIGNVGGYNGGGMDVGESDPRYNQITYSPMHGDHFLRLYADAKNDKHTDYGPYRQPPLPYSMGDGELWKHATQMTSGNFSGTGHSDLLVIWTDGEVTLYPGDGNGGFGSERRLLAPNDTWKPIATITAGDFAGSNQFDLLVRWDDGRMTLHADVGSNGLGIGTEMAGSGSIWSHATQIAAGRFNATTYVTDLMVRWSDGELTLYTNVGAGTLGQEHRLKEPNDTWKDATLLTAGQFSGNQKWDLMVRWSTGELDNYVGTTTGGLGGQQQIHGPNKTWTHSVIMTTGQYTGDGLTNDLVIRWTDGETTMYQNTRTNNLGSERTLVPAA
ncbi:trypsin-like serine protease [Streptomyces goshikiensis]|uniref:trypsin-like serine peptidase n=1 Tax=Streptomyces goshikiensis TaxID=1942 RepID=UPI0036BAE171